MNGITGRECPVVETRVVIQGEASEQKGKENERERAVIVRWRGDWRGSIGMWLLLQRFRMALGAGDILLNRLGDDYASTFFGDEMR
jgi:hypothetical protein